MTTGIVMINANASIAEAMEKMLDKRISSLIVGGGDSRRIITRDSHGIITQGDIVNNIIAYSRDPKKVKVEYDMSQPLLTVPPDMSIKNAIRLMMKANVGRFPVVDGDKLIGLISEGDILRAEVLKNRE